MVADIDFLTGQDDRPIDYQSFHRAVHGEIVEAFKCLQTEASRQGFELEIASGYRDFQRQLLIWNEKAAGQRVVLDANGSTIVMSELDPWQQVQAILCWSALPGASRHHWGTDIDVYDRAAVGDDYKVQLTSEECSGPFCALHDWLDECIASDNSFGFFRPYQSSSARGIAPERWHLSYAPLSSVFEQELSVDLLVELLTLQPIALKDTLLDHIDEIYKRFIRVANELYPVAYQR